MISSRAALVLVVALALCGCDSKPKRGGATPGPADAGTVKRDGPPMGPHADAGAGTDSTPADSSLPIDVPADGAAGDVTPPDAAADAPPSGIGEIIVENLQPGETVPHDLVVIEGRLELSAAGRISVEVGGRTGGSFQVAGGRFRALALLAPGQNQVRLQAAALTRTLTLTYQPPANPRFIRFLYIVAADGDGSFAGPDGLPLDQAAALARMRVNARLMQTFTAETMRRIGFGRRTFRLARDANHEPIVEVFKTRMTSAEARGMDGNALWSAFYSELGGLPDRANSLDVAVMSMSQYQPDTRTTLAHTALGGGRLGLFGSATLYAHAATLEDVPAKFSDETLVDTTKARDDSAGRGTIWANFATGIGATQHEMGHCLSLPHPANRQGFMARAFDHFNRTFAVAEPRSKTGMGLAPTLPNTEAGLDRSNAVRLRFHRWMQPGAVTYQVNQPPTFTVDAAGVTIASPAGIRHVQYLVNGDGADHDEHLMDPPPPSVTLTLDRLRTRFPTAMQVNISTIDDAGNIATRNGVVLR